MRVSPSLWIVSALLSAGLCAPAAAQWVYKCGARTYSQQPCSKRLVNTDDAPVPAKPNPRKVDVSRLEQNRILARNLRREPGETVAEFDKRRQRTRMLQADSAECARLDKRMPVEEASMKNPNPEEVQKAQAALAQSRKRFSDLRC